MKHASNKDCYSEVGGSLWSCIHFLIYADGDFSYPGVFLNVGPHLCFRWQLKHRWADVLPSFQTLTWLANGYRWSFTTLKSTSEDPGGGKVLHLQRTLRGIRALWLCCFPFVSLFSATNTQTPTQTCGGDACRSIQNQTDSQSGRTVSQSRVYSSYHSRCWYFSGQKHRWLIRHTTLP